MTNRAFVVGLLIIGIAAAFIRLYFVSQVLHFNPGERIVDLDADSLEYVQLAQHMVATGTYGGHDPVLQQFSLMRTPGYPAFCSIFALLSGSLEHILFAQAILGALVAMGTMLLTRWIYSNDLLGFLSGLASALSPTGIGMTGMVLVEIVLIAGLLTGMLLLTKGVARDSWLLCVLAGVVFGISVLVKPILVLWPCLSILIWGSLSKNQGQSLRWRQAWLLLGPQILITVVWCWHNYATHGAFSLSSIGPETTRYYFAARVEALSLTGDVPSNEHERIRDIQRRLRARDQAEYMSGQMTLAEVANRQTRESLEIFRKFPWIAVRVYAGDIRESLVGLWDYFSVQIPEDTWLRRFLEKLNRDLIIPLWVQSMLVAGSLAGFIPWLPQNRWGSRRSWGSVALILIVGYFGALSGTTFWVGSRIRYPVEFAQIALLLGGAWALANRIFDLSRFRGPDPPL